MKLLTVLLGVFCLAYGLSAAPITSGALPDETVLLDSSDPFGLGYKFTMSGVDYYWTNQPTVVEKDVTALTALGASNTVYVGWFQGLWSKSNEWNAAFAWGDWSASVASNTAAIVVLQTNTVTKASTNGWIVTSHEGFLTDETDAAALAALAAHSAYWPPNATASSWFTFVTNSGAITITGYNIEGGTDVVIPDYINGWPVTTIGLTAFAESGVTSIGGAGNVVTVEASAFGFCASLASVSLPQVQTVGGYAFELCYSLASVSLPQVQTLGDSAFASCSSLASVSLPQVQTLGDYAFYYCDGLTSLYFDNDAPTIGAYIFEGINPNQVTNYVTNPTASGWTETLGGMPVVRPAVYSAAPAWIAITNLASQTTVITNAAEAPVTLYATGSVEVAFSALRPPLPLYLVVAGPSSLTFPVGTRFIGGGSWQTNRANHFIVWMTGTNLFVNPLIATEE